MIRKIFLLIALIIIFSCGEEVIEKPTNLISKEKMINILYDLAVIDAAKSTGPREIDNKNFVPMEFIYKKYEIDSIQFVSSDLYYASKPLEYEDIYKKIEDRIKKEKERIEELAKKKKDSLIQKREEE